MRGINYKDTSLLLLRLFIVFIFLWHGLPKLVNPSGSTSFFESLGLPGFSVVVIGLVETAAAIVLLLGLWSKWANYALAIVMVGTLVLVHIPALAERGVTSGFERDALILLVTLVLAAHGPGHLALVKSK